ncbi:MAG: urea ABC transporter permease subunit UrtC [Bauldia sp.]|nr:urea ABC transporter permease subunit UrtC [Bauldia sp.]
MILAGRVIPPGQPFHLDFERIEAAVFWVSAAVLALAAIAGLAALGGLLWGARIGWTGYLVVAILLLVAVAVPVLNLWTAPTHPLHVPNYAVSLFGKYLTYALLALSVGLIWGYCGILSLGHGAFFALGGYAIGMYLMRQIGARGVYANPDLPDFMVFLNWRELPFFWHFFDGFPYATLMVMAVPGVLAFVFGWFAFRSRVTGVYLSIITQALTYALLLAFFRNDFGFGGNNGLTDFKDILGFNIQAPTTRATLFAASAIALAIGYLMCRAMVSSKFGKVLVALRDAESRTRFLGYRVERYKLAVFVISAAMAGVAGALYVPQVGIINPGEFAPENSIEAVIWVAVGGRGTLVGPIIGATIVNYAKTVFTTGALAPYWPFVLGGLFVVVTLFLPKGIVGTVQMIWNRMRERRAAAPPREERNADGHGTAVPPQANPQLAE